MLPRVYMTVIYIEEKFISTFYSVRSKNKILAKIASFFAWEEGRKTSVGSIIACGRLLGAAPSSSVCVHQSLTPPCGRHKQIAPNETTSNFPSTIVNLEVRNTEAIETASSPVVTYQWSSVGLSIMIHLLCDAREHKCNWWKNCRNVCYNKQYFLA